jgi:branched-chain amino acid transport system permease protein
VTTLLQLLTSGVLLGGIYALAAFGLALIFGLSNILNLAHGEFLMLGALVCFLLGDGFGINPFISLLLVLPLFFLLGVLLERGLLHRILTESGHEHLTASVLVTLGLSLFLEDIARFVWGAEEKGLYFSLPPLVLGEGALVISSVRLLALGCISVNPFIGLPLTLRYLCIIVLGGLGSLFGALVGGIVLGLTPVYARCRRWGLIREL